MTLPFPPQMLLFLLLAKSASGANVLIQAESGPIIKIAALEADAGCRAVLGVSVVQKGWGWEAIFVAGIREALCHAAILRIVDVHAVARRPARFAAGRYAGRIGGHFNATGGSDVLALGGDFAQMVACQNDCQT